MAILSGSICLSEIPREQMKKVMCKDGVERIYVNVAVIERKEKSQFGHTHFITCSPKKRSASKVSHIFLVTSKSLYLKTPLLLLRI